MKAKRLLLITMLLTPLAVLHAADAPKPAARPNILILLADDMGYGDPGCYNPKSTAMNVTKSDLLKAIELALADEWDAAHRVPFIVRWPGILKPGSVCHQLVHQADLLRTFADKTRCRPPACSDWWRCERPKRLF